MCGEDSAFIQAVRFTAAQSSQKRKAAPAVTADKPRVKTAKPKRDKPATFVTGRMGERERPGQTLGGG